MLRGAMAIVLAVVLTGEAATNTFTVVNSGASAYAINGNNNPTLSLVRGFTYSFQINAPGHPFWIKTVQGNGTGDAYTNGVSGNQTQIGTLVFAVPTNAPSPLFYNCELHQLMTGQILIENPPSVRITRFAITTNLVFTSTGTSSLNVRVNTTSNLITGTWSPASVLTNSYADGTNTTTISLPLESVVFFQVRQTLP